MAESSGKERRNGWIPTDWDPERDVTRPLRPEEIREQHHDEQSQTIEGERIPPPTQPKPRTRSSVMKRKAHTKTAR
jgi:hypothetical protein